MRFFFLVIFLLFLSPYFSSAQDFYTDPRTGISLRFDTGYGMFPKHWYSKKIKAEAWPLAQEEKERATRITLDAFAKYPVDILKKNLQLVYILQRISFFGIPFGGTNYGNIVYLADNMDNPNYTEDYIKNVFYHEFSSILLRKYHRDMDKKTWEKINPSDFRYGKGGVEAIRTGTASMKPDRELMKEGFICSYSLSSFEEDFNIYSQYLFRGGKEFWDLTDQYEKVKAKTYLLIRFYQNIDPGFNEGFFRNL